MGGMQRGRGRGRGRGGRGGPSFRGGRGGSNAQVQPGQPAIGMQLPPGMGGYIARPMVPAT
eukprot:gene21031-7874_t